MPIDSVITRGSTIVAAAAAEEEEEPKSFAAHARISYLEMTCWWWYLGPPGEPGWVVVVGGAISP